MGPIMAGAGPPGSRNAEGAPQRPVPDRHRAGSAPMSAPHVLFIGGTGVISSACVRRAVATGWQVSVLNRGRSTTRPLPEGVEALHADAHDPATVRQALEGRRFDAVADFMTFAPDQAGAAVDTLDR